MRHPLPKDVHSPKPQVGRVSDAGRYRHSLHAWRFDPRRNMTDRRGCGPSLEWVPWKCWDGDLNRTWAPSTVIFPYPWSPLCSCQKLQFPGVVPMSFGSLSHPCFSLFLFPCRSHCSPMSSGLDSGISRERQVWEPLAEIVVAVGVQVPPAGQKSRGPPVCRSRSPPMDPRPGMEDD